MPSLIYVGLNSSFAIGLFLSVVLTMAMPGNGRIYRPMGYELAEMAPIVAIFLASACYSGLVSGNEKSLSIIPLFAVMYCSYAFSRKIRNLNIYVIVDAFYFSILIILAFGWLAYFQVINFNIYAIRGKPAFPFSEHSHLALAVGGLFFAIFPHLNLRKFLFVFINIVGLAVLLPSFTLMVFVLAISIVQFMRYGVKYLLPIGVSLAIVLYFLGMEFLGLDYFSSRIVFSDSDNTTTLVWLQGWEFAFNGIMSTHGLGWGFQMLGRDDRMLTETSELINRISQIYLNFEDGGFLAAKIIAEFGILGLIFVLIFLKYFIIYAKNLKKMDRLKLIGSSDAISESARISLFLGLGLSVMVEVFFRGQGYFSTGVFFAASGFWAYRGIRHNIKFRQRSTFISAGKRPV